jgi:hypothetical protein
MSRSARTLLVCAVIAGLFEVITGPFLGNLPGVLLATTFGIGFLAAGYFIWRGSSRIPAVVLGLLFLVEAMGVPFLEKSSVADSVIQYSFGALSLVGLASAVMVLAGRGIARVPADRVA